MKPLLLLTAAAAVAAAASANKQPSRWSTPYYSDTSTSNNDNGVKKRISETTTADDPVPSLPPPPADDAHVWPATVADRLEVLYSEHVQPDDDRYFRLKRIYQQEFNDQMTLVQDHYDGQVLFRDLTVEEQRYTAEVAARAAQSSTTAAAVPVTRQSTTVAAARRIAAGDQYGLFHMPRSVLDQLDQMTLAASSASTVPPPSPLTLSAVDAIACIQRNLRVSQCAPYREAVLAFARMSMYAYQPPPQTALTPTFQPPPPPPTNQTDLTEEMPLFGDLDLSADDPPSRAVAAQSDEHWQGLDGWQRRTSPGWNGTGLRAHVFEAIQDNIMVVSFKGTSVPFITHGGQRTRSITQDRVNDNLMFSCCCGRPSLFGGPYCGCRHGFDRCDAKCVAESTHFRGSYQTAGVAQHPNVRILLSGHSLGASVASLVAASVPGVAAIAFEAPGEAQFAHRLGLPRNTSLPIWHFGHTADPIYTGNCGAAISLCQLGGYTMQTRCHLGYRCLFDPVRKLGWSISLLNHQSNVIIDRILLPWTLELSSRNNTGADGNNLAHASTSLLCELEDDCVDCADWQFTTPGDKVGGAPL